MVFVYEPVACAPAVRVDLAWRRFLEVQRSQPAKATGSVVAKVGTDLDVGKLVEAVA